MKSKIRILVVDDEKPIRDMLSRHFRFLDYDIVTAEDGVDALQFMERNKIDILMTDIKMPRMDGLELTQKVKDEYPLVRIIVVTGYVTLSNAMACLQNGADGIFSKPLEDMAPLENAVKRSTEILQEWAKQLSLLTNLKPSGGENV